jgi:hypothetical protein
MPNGNGTIDYDALAKQYGASSSTAPAIDYDALAQQHGATSSAPATAAASGPPSALTRLYTSVGEGIKQPFQATAEELSRLNRAAGQGRLFQQIRSDFPPLGSVTGALASGYGQFNPITVKKDAQGNIDWPSTIGATAGKAATMAAPLFMGTPEGAAPETLSANKYSTAGDKIASSLKPVSGLDVPAVANRALPALQESFADIGGDPRSFQGREGTLLFKQTVQHAVDLTENRANQVLAPILDQPADPNVLAKSPDLTAWLGTDQDVTNGMINDARKEANKVLARGNYFLKPRSKQLAATDMQADAFNVASQARNALYGAAQDATGYDLRPLRSMESDLINLADAANATHNALSGQEARFQAAGPAQRVIGGLKAAIAVKASPTSALSVGEQPGLFSPLKTFNNNMQNVFSGIRPQAADLDMGIQQAPQRIQPPPYSGLPQVNMVGPPPQYSATGQIYSGPRATPLTQPVIGSMVTAVSQRQP